MSDYKRIFIFYMEILRGQIWTIFPLAAGICMGAYGASQLGNYVARIGMELPVMDAFAYLMEERPFFGLAGGIWACVFLCAGLDYRGVNNVLCRGYSRSAVFFGGYCWFLIGCLICSLSAQLSGMLLARVDFTSAGAVYILRNMAIRLVLDIGVMSTPLLAVYVLKRTLPALCVCGLYGVALYVAHTPHYEIWIVTDSTPPLSSLWPVAALIVVPAVSGCIWLRAELK